MTCDTCSPVPFTCGCTCSPVPFTCDALDVHVLYALDPYDHHGAVPVKYESNKYLGPCTNIVTNTGNFPCVCTPPLPCSYDLFFWWSAQLFRLARSHTKCSRSVARHAPSRATRVFVRAQLSAYRDVSVKTDMSWITLGAYEEKTAQVGFNHRPRITLNWTLTSQ